MNGRRLDVPAQASTSTMENPFLSGLGLPFLLGPRPPSAVRRPPIADRRSPPAAMPRHRAVLLLLAGAADEAAAAFSAATPCPPPRFDSFSDAVVGGWERRGGAASSPPSAAPGVDEVQEVMRSCGGAVQGAREVPLGLGRREGEEEKEEDGGVGEGRYHNRADDGFVYFDCGSYSAGPVQLGKGNGRNGEEVMGSLAFSSVPRRRALVSLPVGSGGGDPVCDIRDGRLVVLGRVPFRSSTGGTAASSAAGGGGGGQKLKKVKARHPMRSLAEPRRRLSGALKPSPEWPARASHGCCRGPNGKDTIARGGRIARTTRQEARRRPVCSILPVGSKCAERRGEEQTGPTSCTEARSSEPWSAATA